jgi:hypothetical protein
MHEKWWQQAPLRRRSTRDEGREEGVFFQHFVKGTASAPPLLEILRESGILCNWWRNVGNITPKEMEQRLTERNLLWHLSHYDDPDPDEGNEEFGSLTYTVCFNNRRAPSSAMPPAVATSSIRRFGRLCSRVKIVHTLNRRPRN